MQSSAVLPENSSLTIIRTLAQITGTDDKLELFAGPLIESEHTFVTGKMSDYLRAQIDDKHISQSVMLSDVVIAPNIIPPEINAQSSEYKSDLDEVTILQDAIVAEFNKKITADKYVLASKFKPAEELKSNEFMVVTQAGEVQIITTRHPLRVPKNHTSVETKKVDIYTLDDGYFGECGTMVLVVPVGKFALVMQNAKAVIYDEGIHVISALSISFDPKKNYVNKNKEHISHGNINILNVPTDMLARVILQNNRYFFESKNRSYVFTDPTFEYHQCVASNQNAHFFGNLVRLTPAADQITVLTLDGIRHYLSHDAQDVTARYIETPFDAIGFLSTSEKQRAFKMEVPISASLELEITIDINYRVIKPERYFSDIIEIKPDLDIQIANQIKEIFFRAMTKIVQHRILTGDVENEKKSISIQEIDLIQTVFKNEALPQIQERLGVEFKPPVLDIQCYNRHLVPKAQTMILPGDGSVYKTNNSNLVFSNSQTDDKSQTQQPKNVQKPPEHKDNKDVHHKFPKPN